MIPNPCLLKMRLSGFERWLRPLRHEDACLPDAQSDACKQEDCDRVFMAANAKDRGPGTASGSAAYNLHKNLHNKPDNLSRWEFIEVRDGQAHHASLLQRIIGVKINNICQP